MTEEKKRVHANATLGKRLREVSDEFNRLTAELDKRGVSIEAELHGHVLTVARLEVTQTF